ncbi:hypothetical protein WN944_014465 [Citrus x changshan-huyou]|uniref:Uncharacterized protein n=1 Tax=Citrus x changshan-huyou TaxID=2935761 RepID=A0AAP0M760_9ROSI
MVATLNKQFKNICVLSGFNYDKHKEFIEPAINLGRSIAERKLHLVYGGGNRELSKLVSEAAFVRESQVLGIIPKALKSLDNLSDSLTGEELVVSGDLATLETLITLASWAHMHIHQKPIAYRPKSDPRTFVLECPNNDGNSSRSKKCKLDLSPLVNIFFYVAPPR